MNPEKQISGLFRVGRDAYAIKEAPDNLWDTKHAATMDDPASVVFI